MDIFEQARSYKCMIEMKGLSQSELGRLLGVTQSAVANKLRLLRLCPEVQKRVVELGVSERHARELLRLEDEGKQLELLERIGREKMSVARCEALVNIACIKEAPTRISGAERMKATNTFLDSVSSSVKSLSSLGIEITEHKKYYKNKLYLTLCITENE